MALFRTFVLQENTHKTSLALKYVTFAIGAYFEKVNNKLALKFALNTKQKTWFSELWNNAQLFEYPFFFLMRNLGLSSKR